MRLDVFKHPAHSPELSPSDFYVFGPETPTFTSDGDGWEVMVPWRLGSTARNFLQMGICRLVQQGDSCLRTSCDCFIIVPGP